MGMHGLRELCESNNEYEIIVLARPGRKNIKKLSPFLTPQNSGNQAAKRNEVRVVWGDLTDYEAVRKAMDGVDIVLHVGGMVSPAADWYPEKTISTNVGAMDNIIRAAKEMSNEPAVVYIGSVAQYGNRDVPDHWGQAGDVLIPAYYDAYAYSKVEAERLLVESGLKKWVSLRQTGILHSGLLMKASDPIAFHVPIKGVLEWITAEDSGRLLERVCREEVPDSFWNHFYNIGGGASYRMTNYEFESRLLKAMGCPRPEQVFDARWFATGNFHGFWFADSDRLEELLHFRGEIDPDSYFRQMKSELPWYFSMAPLAPAFMIKAMMKRVANTPVLGPMWWIKERNEGRIRAAFGSIEEWEKLPGWDDMDLSRPDDKDPGYVLPEYTYKYLEEIVRERGGEIVGGIDEKIYNDGTISAKSDKGYEIDPDDRIELKCDKGHHFKLKARSIIEGGHWCPECVRLRVNPEWK